MTKAQSIWRSITAPESLDDSKRYWRNMRERFNEVRRRRRQSATSRMYASLAALPHGVSTHTQIGSERFL